jgi:hypothetical protein
MPARVPPVTARPGWIGGLAEWTDEETRTAYLSVAFTWKLPEAQDRARWYRALGYRVVAGGPATTVRKKFLADDVDELGGAIPDAVRFHNPDATVASRGCPVGCWFCIVPKMEGRAFTLLPDFPVRPILCDNNLSGLPFEYQQHIVERYRAANVPLLDANSGFEPRTFDGRVFELWRTINRGPWRFAYDDLAERGYVREVMRMLEGIRPKLKRVYVLIGNEPFDVCMQRIAEVLEWGGEPHVQPFVKLNALERVPDERNGWTRRQLLDVARWANRRVWKYATFAEYRRSAHTAREATYDAQQGLFT